MKLRFHDGSVRLRLSQSDVAQLAAAGRIEDAITFAPGQTISYAVESGEVTSISATFLGNRISVVLPAAVAKNWIASDQTGVEGGSGAVRVLVEKDFQCLHGEQDADAFLNPEAAN